MKRNFGLSVLALSGAILLSLSLRVAAAPVTITEDRITIPTYLLGEPEPNPIFYDGRASQGAQGRVYPYPLYDRLTNVKSNKIYRIVYLENEYIRIGVLPEIGGRLFEAIDKSNGYNFVYRQHVIKPALIGLIGAWISGGIEWNIPHHHRATTALPVSCETRDNKDGSKTIWVGEEELRHRMRWAVGYTLRPGRSYLECEVRILNDTPLVNTMLCFANVAVHVNQDYQVIYPPDTRFVTFHSKHDFTTWPIATTRYAGTDFTRGVDVSWYSNHISATSMFAWNYQDDFFAGYDHGRKAGIISVADHHIVPGKKFWTWGNGPRGRMWDKILTDSDGPYIELMVGAYSDNQPDYSWIQPYETKAFQMFWYPFRDIDGVKKANLNAAVNLEITSNHVARIGFCTTAEYPSATALLQAGTNILFNKTIAIGPAKTFLAEVKLPEDLRENDLKVTLRSDGRELVTYSPQKPKPEEMPKPVIDPPPPAEVKTVEELYLAGQRLEQFHSPNGSPEPYWEEALKRDPGNSQVHTAWGIRLLKQARFDSAESHFRTAIERLTHNYTAPKNGEPFYYLGVTLENKALTDAQPDTLYEAAADAFYKATWSQGWRGPAYFALAELASLQGKIGDALSYANSSLDANRLNTRALQLKTALLRREGNLEAARALLGMNEDLDPLDPRFAAERWLAGDQTAGAKLCETLHQFPAAGLEIAAEYFRAGLWADGRAVLQLLAEPAPSTYAPLVEYWLAAFEEKLGDQSKADECRQLAAQAPPDYAFPFQTEIIAVLRHAIAGNPRDARAQYFLGNLYYDWQPDEAVKLWEKAAALEPSFAIVHRNLALVYRREGTQAGDLRAISELEQAVAAPVRYALHFAELDELYAKTAAAPEKRLALLEQNQEVVAQRDDSLSREIGLLIFEGNYKKAIDFMTGRKFSVWEGGKLEVAQHWVNAHLLLGRKQLAEGNGENAAEEFEKAATLPENLPNDTEGESRACEISYWRGLAAQKRGAVEKAAKEWHKAVQSGPEISEHSRRGLVRLRQVYYGALAQKALGQISDANVRLKELLRAVEPSFQKAPGRPGPTNRRGGDLNFAQAHCLAGCAYEALGQTEEARAHFKQALEAEPDLLDAKTELAWLP